MIRALAFVAVAAVAVAPAPARADENVERVIGLLDVRGDKVDQVVLERFTAAIEAGLEGGGDFQAAPHARMHEMLAATAWSTACIVGPCLGEVRSQTGAAYVITAGLSGSGMSYRFTLTLVETEKGAVIAQVTESCPACTVEDVESSATLATIELIQGAGIGVEAPAGAPPSPDAQVAALERRVRGHAGSARRTAVLLGGVALLTAAVGYYFQDKDDTDVSYPLFGAAGGLAASGVVILGLSFRF